MSVFDPSQLPNLSGFVAIVTGGHSGIGLATTAELARHGATVYIASRSLSKADSAIAKLKETRPNGNILFLEMDLTKLSSVKKGVEYFLERESKLHTLINNAGIMCAPYSITNDKFEIQLQTNYISHFYLTSLLLPTLLSTAAVSPLHSVRIIHVASDGHIKLAPKTGFDFSNPNLENASTWTRYGQSKLAQVAHARELARRYPDVMSVSLHPGTVKTGLSQGPRGSSWWYRYIQPLVELGAPGPEEGAWGVLWCAGSQELGDLGAKGNGGYFEKVGRVSKANKWVEDGDLPKRLWSWTEEKLAELGI